MSDKDNDKDKVTKAEVDRLYEALKEGEALRGEGEHLGDGFKLRGPLEVEITDEIVSQSRRFDGRACVIATAVNKLLPPGYWTVVNPGGGIRAIRFYREDLVKDISAWVGSETLTEEAAKYAKAFDNDGVAPLGKLKVIA